MDTNRSQNEISEGVFGYQSVFAARSGKSARNGGEVFNDYGPVSDVNYNHKLTAGGSRPAVQRNLNSDRGNSSIFLRSYNGITPRWFNPIIGWRILRNTEYGRIVNFHDHRNGLHGRDAGQHKSQGDGGSHRAKDSSSIIHKSIIFAALCVLALVGAPSKAGAQEVSSASYTIVTANWIALDWQASTTPGVTYNVFRGTVSGGPYSEVASGIGCTCYNDLVASSGTFFYVVTAQDSSGVQSLDSNQASATVPAP